MNDAPLFNIIDLGTWPRKPLFDYYYHQVKCTYSICADVDIEELLNVCKEKSIKLYPALIHIITSTVNSIENLRVAYNENDELGIWTSMDPCYAVFHEDDKTFSNIWTPYHQRFASFYEAYTQDMNTYGAVKAFMSKGDEPTHSFPISCIPWLDFTGLNLNINDHAKILCPIFTIGKFVKREGKMVVPLAVQLHHALCDGYHVGLLFEMIRHLAAHPNEWMNA